ncbi:histone-lysine N-methyltransferase SETMAR [Trichonephila clavipes]|nr:histone-lysine N-methyltransferase SETMAR [Trichonephila clavipes]
MRLIASMEESFFDHLIPADEKWVMYDNPKRKISGSLQMNRHEGLTSQVYIQKKAPLYVWWCFHGIIHFEELKPGETVNADLYCEQLDRLNQLLIEKYPAIIKGKCVILQHDNAKPHCERKMLAKINGLGFEVLLTHHTRLTLRQQISIYPVQCNTS